MRPITNGALRGASSAQKRAAKEATQQLRSAVSAFYLRRAASDIARASLPPKTVHIVCCRMVDDQREAYEEASDPMRVAADMTTPVLVLNTEDDPVCSVINVHRHRDAMQKLPRTITALTRYGGHCGYYEGWNPESSWADRAITEYLSAMEVERHQR